MSSALLIAAQPSHAADARLTAIQKTAIAAGESVIAAKLKDPNSAQFREMRAYPIKGAHLVVVCGEVTGRTEFGNVGRYRQFITAVRDGKGDPDEAEFYDPTQLTDYPISKRCEMAAHGKTFYQTDR